MTALFHMRGDVGGMLLYFFLLFLGLLQLLVAWKRLSGLSLTGYPDRRRSSVALGVLICVGSSAWYFSRPGHFASPDVEGMESFLLLAIGLAGAVIAQAAVSTLVFRRRVFMPTLTAGPEEVVEELELELGNSAVPATFIPPARGASPGTPVLLLHDYGAIRASVAPAGAALAGGGHPVLTLDLDGHGDNPRPAESPLMEELLAAAVKLLKEKTGSDHVAVVGAGLGGTLAVELAARESSVRRAVALDPPSREVSGMHSINSARELKAATLVRAFARPPVRGRGGKTLSLSGMLSTMPPPTALPADKVTVLGTSGWWLNSPDSLRRYSSLSGLEAPVPLPWNHSSLPHRVETIEAVEEALSAPFHKYGDVPRASKRRSGKARDKYSVP